MTSQNAPQSEFINGSLGLRERPPNFTEEWHYHLVYLETKTLFHVCPPRCSSLVLVVVLNEDSSIQSVRSDVSTIYINPKFPLEGPNNYY